MAVRDSAEHGSAAEGLAADLAAMTRRRALMLAGGALLAGRAASAATCDLPAAETAGPFPADGSTAQAGRVVNVLGQDGIARVNLKPAFGGLKGTAVGLPVHLEIALVDAGAGCAPLAGLAVYLWHCDAAGRYSLYDLPETNYLRGLGVADSGGVVRFDTIFPGCYRGRWPHLHFEVFESAATAVAGQAAILTSQFALPQSVCASVYGTEADYAASKANFAGQSLGSDMVFRDNSAAEMAAMMVSVKRDPMAGTQAWARIGIARAG